MIDMAVKYEEELKKHFCDIMFKEKYKFFSASSYFDVYKAFETTWDKHEFVSVDSNGDIIGYIGYSISRDDLQCHGLEIINFTDNILIFGKDVMSCLDDIFTKFSFRKLSYCVVCGNPIEKTYDKLTQKYGGRVIGVKKRDCKLFDGNYYDIKMYEIFRDDYLKNRIYFRKGE